MDYKMFFKKAFSDIRKEHSCPDNETVVNNILERAKTMNNNNENERTYNTRAYEVQPTPTKGHKALSVVAGIAGTAAVLAGAVFGLNWLSEHGGLKEGGIGSSNGAGYHEDMTEPAQSAAETTNALIATEDIRYDIETPENVFEFDGVSAIVDWWQFDGKTLKLQYDIDFGTNRCEDIESDISPRITPIGNFEASTTLEIFDQKENSIKMRATIELFHYTDSISLSFLDNNEYVRMKHGEIEMMSPDAYRELEISLIDFKKLAVHYTYSKDTDAFDDMEVYGCHRGKTYITHDAVSFEFSDITDVSVFDSIKLVIVDFDNNETPLGEGTLTLDESGTSGVLTFPTNGIDFDIGKIYAYRWDETSAESESAIMATWDRGECKNILDAVGDVLDFGDMTATIEKVDYDGHFIRVIYKADYHGGLSNDADWWFYQQHRRLSLYSYRNPVKNNFEGSWDTLPELGDNRFILATEITLDEGESIDNLWFEYMPEGAKLTEESVHIGSYIVNGVDHEKYDRSLTIRHPESDIGVINLSPNGMIIISNIDFMCEFAKEKDCLLKYKDETTEVFESSNYGAIYYEELDEEYIDSILAEQGLTRDDLVPRAPDEDEKNGWTKLVWMKPGQIDVDNVAAVILNGEEISFEKKPVE